ncbi:MAG: PD-(D/E)XK nuclease family protein [Clostridia bacterium]|nr:PD-(D/E)XK nuclease family protein [Clostridia bacterium]
MLTLLFGTDLSGKRAEVDAAVMAKVRVGERVRLVVPEQENYTRDRRLMEAYGERDANLCRTTSFTHFAAEYLEEKGRSTRPAADEAGLTLLMSLALRSCRAELTYYARYDRRAGSLGQLLAFYQELKNAGRTPDDLGVAAQRLTGTLAAKANELRLVFSAFEGLAGERFSDVSDNLNAVADLIEEDDSLRDVTFYFDDFRGFTEPQLRLIGALMNKAKAVYVSLTTEETGSHKFAHADKNRRRLVDLAHKAGVKVVTETVAPAASGTGLSKLRRDLFREDAEKTAEAPADITLVSAANKYEICDFIAMRLNELLLSGACRARDAAVLYRDDTLTPILLSSMKKYGVPAYADRRRDLFTYPLTRMLLSGLRLAANGFDTETVFSYLKTDVAGLGLSAVADLENYVYRWQIDSRAWERPFTACPTGYGNDMTAEDEAFLASLNASREALVGPILKLRRRLKDGTGKSDAEAAFLFLKETGADEAFLNAAKRLSAEGEESEALAYAGVWDRCMDALDALARAAGDTPLEPQTFCELMTVLFHADSVGSVPTGVDKVQCGHIDRVRAIDPYVLFLPDFTEGTYPRSASAGRLLSPKELRSLSAAELDLGALPEDVYEEEKLIVFTALASPTKELYLGIPNASVSGEALSPSAFLSDLKALFPSVPEVRFADLPLTRRALTPDAAFERLAGLWGDPGAEGAALKEALEAVTDGGSYSPEALERAKNGVKGGFADPAVSRRLFGDRLYLSASKAESYHKCPFAFLCRYGLGADKLEISRIDARINGLLVHEALEKVFRAFRGEDLPGIPDETLRAEADRAVDDYIESSLSGRENLSPAVLRTIDRVREDIYGILDVIKKEFAVSSFVMRDMELEIGNAERGVPAYELPLSGGARLVLTGSVDRVDTMQNGGDTYLRVVDYKTGGKEFRLSDVFEGLNMQMLLYLFALCQNGKARYNDPLPAGVLYVPAKTAGGTLGRRAGDEDLSRLRLENGKMNGVVLSNESVIRGMERDANMIFINAGVTPNGDLKGNLLTADDFKILHDKTDRVLTETGEAILGGEFPPVPIEKSGQSYAECDYCPYAAVCLKESGCETRKVGSLKHDEAVNLLREEAENRG